MDKSTKLIAMTTGTILGILAIWRAEKEEKEALKEYKKREETLNNAIEHVGKDI